MSYELLTNRKTENRHKNYRQVNDIFFLVVHWWDDKKGLSFDSNVNFLCKNNNKVSAHYVSEGGRVAQIAENEDVALHAGNWNMTLPQSESRTALRPTPMTLQPLPNLS